jgi:hypothetical protein
MRHGYGVMLYANNDSKYKGNWSVGCREGEGKMVFPNGMLYAIFCCQLPIIYLIFYAIGDKCIDGLWRNDQLVQGIILYRNGDKYCGGIFNGLRSGLGVLVVAKDGAELGFEGLWAENNLL